MSTSVLLEAAPSALSSAAIGVSTSSTSEPSMAMEVDVQRANAATADASASVSTPIAAPEPMQVDAPAPAPAPAPEQGKEAAIEMPTPAPAPAPAPTPEAEPATRPSGDDARAVARARRRLQIQLQFVEAARQQVLAEVHPDFIARMVKIDAERERLLAEAERHRAYWQHSTAVVHVYECAEAESDYARHCDSLQREMRDEIQHEIDVIKEQRSGGGTSARKTTRKTRSTRSKGADDRPSYGHEAAQRAKKRWGNVYQVLENRLAQSEVERDLHDLESSYEAMAKKRRVDAPYAPDLPYVAKHYRASLLYREEVFQEGDEVFIRNFMTGSEYLAILCAITSTELFVLSEKGKYHRLVMMDLRQGRVVITPLSPAQLAALDDRDSSARN